jgi:carbamoyltransferase
MRVLGLGGSHHDFCACVVEDDQVRFGVEEERLNRVKTSFGVGARLQRCTAADYVLDAAGLTVDDIDLVVGNDFLNPVYTLRFEDRITWISHHLSHAASAYYTSPFPRAAVLVVDGRGSDVTADDGLRGETISMYLGEGADLDLVGQQAGRVTRTDQRSEDPYEDSIGWMYETVSKCIGFVSSRTGMGQPGKTMGLAPYGTPRFSSGFADFYELRDGTFHQSTEQQIAMREWATGLMQRAGDDWERCRADLAYGVQEHTEHILLALVEHLHETTGATSLCFAGGVALNSVANYRLRGETGFEDMYVVPAAGDSGTALGAALYGSHQLGGVPRTEPTSLFLPYLGREYGTSVVREALDEYADELVVDEPADVYAVTAEALADGQIVGWFQGRSESGPRALGNRSILADPRRADMKDHLNAKVKHREPFRPFAPVVLEAHQSTYFCDDLPSYHMLYVSDVREDQRETIPAVTHVDGSARLQTTNAALNPQLTRLIEAFGDRTGVYVVLNTSFNDNEEPIVETPADAIRCFLKTDIDLLVLGNLTVRKRQVAQGAAPTAASAGA